MSDRRNVLIMITGGIAAYKTCYLVRLLMEHDCAIRVVMSRHAGEFVRPLTFHALTGEPPVTDLFSTADPMAHIALAEWADVAVVAPATANILGKLAHGIADDAVSTLALTLRCPLLVAPAMNTAMWTNAATRENVAVLRHRGVRIIGPGTGLLACRTAGPGKMAEPSEIAGFVLDLLDDAPTLYGERLLVSAGPTRERVDLFRFLSNPSSGRMGVAIAAAAQRAGAGVCLVHGPLSVALPSGVETVAVESAAEMAEALEARFPEATALIMAAAVSDFTPAEKLDYKVKKEEALTSIALEPTVDILQHLATGKQPNQITIGFSAESQDLVENAQKKLARKNLDAIVANDISRCDAGFQAETNEVVILRPDREPTYLPLQEKRKVALAVLRELAALRQEKRESGG
jgi:phosphopantothenoylcysteine decarboxylase / phosphopantothenate---cysteine ligase